VNENEIERLMRAHGDSLGVSSRRHVVPPPPRWGRRMTIGFASLAVVITTTMMLWPRDVVASTLARVNRQITDAKSFEERIYMRIQNRWVEPIDISYQNNMWRIDSAKGMSTLECLRVFRDGKVYERYKALDFTTVWKARPNELGDPNKVGESTLEFVKGMFAGPEGTKKQKAQLVEHESVDGKPTYMLIFDRPADHWRLEILVDKDTDMPIHSELTMVDRWNKPLLYKSEIQINHPIDPLVFAPPTQGEVVRLPEDLQVAADQWTKPVAKVEHSDIQNVSVSADGTIWIAVTTPPGLEKPAMPSTVSDLNGTKYVRIQDIDPASMSSRKEMTIGGKSIYITGFVPIVDNGLQPLQVKIGFARREAYPPFFSDSFRKEGLTLKETVTLQPAVESGNWPQYFRYLGISHFLLQIPVSTWSARAQALESNGDLLQAARAYEKLAEARYNWVKYSAFQPMLDAAKLYRRLGDTVRAADLEVRAEALKESRER